MKTPRLYIKNEKGRYEPYEPPAPDISDSVYRKINGKYEPVGLFQRHDHLTEGVWVVTSDRSFCNGKYIKDRFRLDKVSDLQYPSIAEFGGLRQISEQAIEDFYRIQRERCKQCNAMSNYEAMEYVIQRAVELLKEKQK